MHTQLLQSLYLRATDEMSNIARYTTAIPSITQKNTGATVIIPVKPRIAEIIPTNKLATMASPLQLFLQLQLQNILSPPNTFYAKKSGW